MEAEPASGRSVAVGIKRQYIAVPEVIVAPFKIKLEREIEYIGEKYENYRGLPYTQ